MSDKAVREQAVALLRERAYLREGQAQLCAGILDDNALLRLAEEVPLAQSVEADRAMGYGRPLDSFDVAWLASEVRLLHTRIEALKRDHREAEQRHLRRWTNSRHVLAHQAARHVGLRMTGKHRTAGATALIEWLHPISGCSTDCTGEIAVDAGRSA